MLRRHGARCLGLSRLMLSTSGGVNRLMGAPPTSSSMTAATGLLLSSTAAAPFGIQQRRGYFDEGPKNASDRSNGPSFELYDVRDKDSDGGKLVQVNYRDRNLFISVYPQVGPRKTDPNDPTPQFDYQRRSGTRIRSSEIAQLLSVLEGRQKETQLTTRNHAMKFHSVEGGFTLEGVIYRTQGESVPWKLEFTKSNVIIFHRYLESALIEGFGFRSYSKYEKGATSNSGSSNSGRNQQQQQRGGQQDNRKQAVGNNKA